MDLIARKAFYINNGIGIFRNLENKGFSIKLLGFGVNGLLVGQCSSGFILTEYDYHEKKELVLNVLSKLKRDFFMKELTSQYKITKTIM